MDTAARLEPIPRPPGYLFVGNLFDLDASHPIESLMDLARKYGPIYEIELPGRRSRVIVSGYKLVDELCDESRFDKMLGPGLEALAQGEAWGRGTRLSVAADPITESEPTEERFGVSALRISNNLHPAGLEPATQ